MGAIVHADDEATFEREVLGAEVPVVVDFWATWCGPCHLVAAEIEALATAHGDELRVVKVDVDANPHVAESYGIQSIPTVALFRSGELVSTSIGAKPARALEAELGLASSA